MCHRMQEKLILSFEFRDCVNSVGNSLLQSSPILQPHENMNASSPEKSQADDPQEKQV